MAQDAHDGKDHAGKVAVGIAHEDGGWVAVVKVQCQRNGEEGKEEVDAEEVGVGCWVRVGWDQEVQGVIDDEQDGDDD